MLTDTILRNRYKILQELGRGGFSVTYLAVDMDLPGNPKCVVKQLKTRQSNKTILHIAKKLFEREAQVLYRLGKGHKQIPEMFAHFEENDEFYLVQEFVDGYDLTKEIKPRTRLSEEKVTKLLQEILEVLNFVHENEVIHRDIKLRNIMRRREDGKIVLIDFGAVKEIKGLAKNEQGDVNSTLIIGTPGYMPDEQANGKPRLCSDVYAVGMLGIQALTGIPPRELPFNPNTGELIWRDSAKVSDRFAEILTGMVRHHFSQRYRTAAEALRALKSPEFLPPNTSFSAYEAPVTLPSTVRQSPPWALQTLGLVGLIGIGFGLGAFGWNLFQSISVGNEPVQTTEIPPTINKLNPSTKPETLKPTPLKFSPSTANRESYNKKPIFIPFIPFLTENKLQSDREVSPSKIKVNKAKPALDYKPKTIQKNIQKNIQKKNQPTPKTSIVREEKVEKKEPQSTFLNSQPKNKSESLPSINIPKSEEKAIEDSPKPSTPKPVIEKPKTSLPTESNSVDEVKDKNKDNNTGNLETETTLPKESDAVDEVKDNPEKSEQPPKEQEKPSEEQPKQTPASPNTPAIENTPVIESESSEPQLTPSPTETPTETNDKNKVVVPTNPPNKSFILENNFIYTEESTPIAPIPTPEAESKPTITPQPTPTPETDTQSAATPQPTPKSEENQPSATPQPTPTTQTETQSAATPKPSSKSEENQPTATPQPTKTPEENQPDPQAPTNPIREAELLIIPEVHPSPTPKTKIKLTPQITTSPLENETQAIPQASTPPLPQNHNKVKPAPTPSPTEKPGLSLKGFDI